MTDRYAVRRSENGYGVWDRDLSDWVGPQDLAQGSTSKRADLLNRSQRDHASTYRTVDPPKPVILVAGGEEHPGILDAWSRESGQWWGRVTIGGHGGWYPAAALRQA